MPGLFAMNRCRPGSRSRLVAHDALRVTVLPVDVDVDDLEARQVDRRRRRRS